MVAEVTGDDKFGEMKEQEFQVSSERKSALEELEGDKLKVYNRKSLRKRYARKKPRKKNKQEWEFWRP